MGIYDDVARRPEALLAIIMPSATAELLAPGGGQLERDVIVATAPGAASGPLRAAA